MILAISCTPEESEMIKSHFGRGNVSSGVMKVLNEYFDHAIPERAEKLQRQNVLDREIIHKAIEIYSTSIDNLLKNYDDISERDKDAEIERSFATAKADLYVGLGAALYRLKRNEFSMEA